MFARLLTGPIAVLFWGFSLWGFILTEQYIAEKMSWWAAGLAVILFPVAFAVAPLWAGFVDGYWTPLLVSYAPIILLLLFVVGDLVASAMAERWNQTKWTLLAIILAVVCVSIFQFVFGLLGMFLGYGIVKTTHILWLPIMITAGLTGTASYAGFVAAFRLAKPASRPVTFWIVTAILVVWEGTRWVAVGRDTHALVIVLTISSMFAAGIGGYIAASEPSVDPGSRPDKRSA